MDEDVLAPRLDALYGAAREDFVDERDRHVRDLRDAGKREEAAALSKRRKPTVPAWTVDQLARREPDTVAALLDAGQALRDAQRRAASGRGADDLRSATRRVRDLVTDLRRSAERIIRDAGSSPGTHLEDVERTLFTAAVTPEHHETLRRGVLEKPLEGSGFGGVEGLLVAGLPDDAADTAGPDGAEEEEADAAAREAEERRREEERRKEQERRRLRRHRKDLERSRDDQRGRVERAEAKAAQLRERAAEAEAEAEEAREELESITTELATVEDELSALGA